MGDPEEEREREQTRLEGKKKGGDTKEVEEGKKCRYVVWDI